MKIFKTFKRWWYWNTLIPYKVVYWYVIECNSSYELRPQSNNIKKIIITKLIYILKFVYKDLKYSESSIRRLTTVTTL